MTRVATASAPGKVILMGEHAAVYGHPALVAAVDLRTEAEAEVAEHASASAPERPVVIELPDLGATVERPIERLLALHRRARHQWQRFEAGETDFAPPSALLDAASGPSDAVAAFVELAVAEALSVARPAAHRTLRRVRVRSAAPSGAGFGSSAAVATAVISAVVQALEEQGGLAVQLRGAARAELVEGLALQVERLQHGRPSGVDTAAVRRGGVLRMERSDGHDGQVPGKLLASPLEVFAGVLNPFVLIHTGPAAESTGTVVDAVRHRRKADPRAVDRIFEQIAECTETLTGALRAGTTEDVAATVRASQRLLEKLGVVPAPIQALVRRLEKEGAAAKVSGAGSLAGPGAGALLVYDPGDVLSRFEFDQDSAGGLEPCVLRPRFGAPGVRTRSAEQEQPETTD